MTSLQQIQPAPEVVMVLSQEDKEIRLLDVKTMAFLSPLLKDYATVSSPLAYCSATYQIIATQSIKTIVNIWQTDQELPILKASLGYKVSCLFVDPSQTILVGGSETGSIFVWEIPSGLLLRKYTAHSKKIVSIVVDDQLTIVSASQSEVKSWNLWSFLGNGEKEVRLCNLINMKDRLTTIRLHYSGNLTRLLVLTYNNCLVYFLHNFEKYHSFNIMSPLCFDSTPFSNFLYVGSHNHNIYEFRLDKSVDYKEVSVLDNGVSIDKISKERVLEGHKSPVSCVSWLNSLKYLVSGSQNGEIIVWQSNQIKKQITLKANLLQFMVIPRPSNHRVQKSKQTLPRIKQLLKYELGKQNEPLYLPPCQYFDVEPTPENPRQIYLSMLTELCDEKSQLNSVIRQLELENQHLIKSNNHYAELFLDKFDE